MPTSMNGDDARRVRHPVAVADLERARDHRTLASRHGDAATSEHTLDAIIGTSAAIRRVVEQVRQVLGTSATVLLEGPTGSGKELLARVIHQNGPRRTAAFVTVNCGGLPEDLLTSVLFGHRRGAFTGAIGDQQGVFDVADGGTLFLDEIGETSQAMQVLLLRALEAGEVMPVGACRPRSVDVRVIAASNRNLDAATRMGAFRLDLLHRLRIFKIRVPALEDRREDIPLLAEHLLGRITARLQKRVAGFDAGAMAALMAHRYDGNVRELANLVERGVVLCAPGKAIGVADLFEEGAARSGDVTTGTGETLREAVRAFARQRIAETIDACGGNKSAAARRLGLSYRGLLMKMQSLGMQPCSRRRADAPARDATPSPPPPR